MSGLINSAGSRSGIIGTTELDYEEGTWEATMVDGSGNAVGYAFNECAYTKIGKLVYISGRFGTNSVSGVGGGLKMSLPFATGTRNEDRSAVSIGYLAVSPGAITAGTSVVLRPSGAYMNLHTWDTNEGTSAMTGSEWTTDGQMQFGGCYRTA